MQNLAFCRQRTAGWEGVIFQEDDGRIRITNGMAIWEDSEKRRASLEPVDRIDLARLRDGLERYQLHGQLAAALRSWENGETPADQEYLSRPALEDVQFLISERELCIRSEHTVYAQALAPEQVLDQRELLAQYRYVLKTAKERNIRISYTNHYHKRIRERWPSYKAAAGERDAVYQKMLEQAAMLQQRGIHLGCRDDVVLQGMYCLQERYREFYHSQNPCGEMTGIAGELKRLEKELRDHPEWGGPETRIYL